MQLGIGPILSSVLMLGLSAYGMGNSTPQQQALPTRRLRTWHPGMEDEEEVSDPESVKSMPMSACVSDIDGDNRVSSEDGGRSDDSSSVILLATETPIPSTSAMMTIRKKKSRKKLPKQPAPSRCKKTLDPRLLKQNMKQINDSRPVNYTLVPPPVYAKKDKRSKVKSSRNVTQPAPASPLVTETPIPPTSTPVTLRRRNNRCQNRPPTPRRMRTWHPGMAGGDSSELESVGSAMPISPFISDIEKSDTEVCVGDSGDCVKPKSAGFFRRTLYKFFNITKPIIWWSCRWMRFMYYWQLF